MGKFKPFDKFEHLDSIAVCHEYIKLLEAELRKARADVLGEAVEELAAVAQAQRDDARQLTLHANNSTDPDWQILSRGQSSRADGWAAAVATLRAFRDRH